MATDRAGGWGGVDGLLEIRSRLHAWSRTEERVLAAVAFGSTERTDRPADAWSDLDLLFVVDDERAWLENLDWTDGIERSWVRLVNEAPIPDVHVVQVLFAGGYDADLIPIGRGRLDLFDPPAIRDELFGHGARVVVDRIGAFGRWTDGAGAFPLAVNPAVQPPTQAAFTEAVSIFLYQTVWATKRLLRGERWRAHDDVDDYMRDRLLTMLEWHALARGVDGIFPESRKLEVWVPPDVARALPATFAQYDDRSIAAALVNGHALFRQLAREVAGQWGLEYPDAEDGEIEQWVRARLEAGGLEPSVTAQAQSRHRR